MPGNADVHDEVLARAAAGGDRDAFATLFERHLRSVFEAAWLVLQDRAVAAEIARDTFAAAWQHAGAVEPAAFAASLVESADHKATAWLNENPQALATANAPIPDESPGIGPVLRARIVAGDEDPESDAVHDVPWKASSTASSTTTTDGTSTTETSDTTDEPTSSTSRPRPTTTVRPSNPSPTPTPTTPTTAPRPPTTAAPTQPTILEFTARRDGKCQDGREWVVFTWRAVQATWAWIWPSNAPDPWQDLPGLSGSTSNRAGVTATGIVGAAYTDNDNDPATGTTLYDIDHKQDQLLMQNPPNAGTLTTPVPLGRTTGRKVGFDIRTTPGAPDLAVASLTKTGKRTSRIVVVDLTTGRVATKGTFRHGTLRDITMAKWN